MSNINWDESPEFAERYCHKICAWMKKIDRSIYMNYGHSEAWSTSLQSDYSKNWSEAERRPAGHKALPSKTFNDGDKYERTIFGLCGKSVQVDVYRVLDAYPTNDAAVDHMIKKMLCAGLRGHKDKITDYENAIESMQKALVLLQQKELATKS